MDRNGIASHNLRMAEHPHDDDIHPCSRTNSKAADAPATPSASSPFVMTVPNVIPSSTSTVSPKWRSSPSKEDPQSPEMVAAATATATDNPRQAESNEGEAELAVSSNRGESRRQSWQALLRKDNAAHEAHHPGGDADAYFAGGNILDDSFASVNDDNTDKKGGPDWGGEENIAPEGDVPVKQLVPTTFTCGRPCTARVRSRIRNMTPSDVFGWMGSFGSSSMTDMVDAALSDEQE